MWKVLLTNSNLSTCLEVFSYPWLGQKSVTSKCSTARWKMKIKQDALQQLCFQLQWEQGWRSGGSTRLPPMRPRFKSRRRRHMWVEFVVGSPGTPFFSPGTPVFPSSQKPTLPNSNSIWNARIHLNEFIWTLKCIVGKKAIYNFNFFYNGLLRSTIKTFHNHQ